MFTANNSGGQRRQKRSLKQSVSKSWDPGIVLIAAGVLAAFILVVLTLMFPSEAASFTPAQGEIYRRPSEVRAGSLLLNISDSGHYTAAPRLNTEVKIEVTGMVVFARVVQEFENPGSEWLEGIYVFPLPEDGAVSRLTMDVGDRVIEGLVKERDEARKTYSDAKQEGRKGSLLEQQRPNIFTMAVANIGPHEAIRIELEYQQTVRLDNGIFSLRFPMVVGPRYFPARYAATQNRYEDTDPADLAIVQAEDSMAARITPRRLNPDRKLPLRFPWKSVLIRVSTSAGYRASTTPWILLQARGIISWFR